MGIFSRLLGSKGPPSPPTSVPTPTRRRAPPEPPPARGLADFFTADHRACDLLWAEAEAAADPSAAIEAFRRFDAAMRRHLAWEEDALFPAFEQATGHHGFGPTVIMRGEHDQMRALLDEMDRCAAAADLNGLLAQGDTLMMLIQQHNSKEEGMLYPMAEEALGARGWEAMEPRLK